MIILAILSLFFIAIMISFYQKGENRPDAWMRAGLLWGALVVFITEGFSLFRAITPTGLAISWGVTLVILMGMTFQACRRGARVQFPGLKSFNLAEKIMAGMLVAMLGVTLLVALVAPVQTWDSLTYHMTRVAHWAQDQRVHIFATGTERQNFMSPGAEFITLQFYVLQGSDRLVNLVDWLAYLGCIWGSAWIAGILGAARPAKFLAALAAAGIPIAISQASSSATDIVLSFWCLCLAAEVLVVIKGRQDRFSWLFVGLGASLAILTKPTCFVVLLPLAVWLGIALLRSSGIKTLLLEGMGALAIIAVLNAGYLVRNQLAYSNPLGPADVFAYQGNQIHSLPALASNLIRNTAVHLGTVGPLNSRLTGFIEKIHTWLGLAIDDPKTTQGPRFAVIAPANEDTIGNLSSLGLIVLTLIGLVIGIKQYKWEVWIFVLVGVSGFILYSLVYKWQLFATRLQLPLFILAAPLIGLVLGSWKTPRMALLFSTLLFLSSLVWLLALFPRPLIPFPPRTFAKSILTTSREELYFANDIGLIPRMKQAASLIREADCNQIGIMLGGQDGEYLWWVVLGAPNPQLRIEWIVAGTPSEKYSPPDFKPCAVVCTTCAQQKIIRDLPSVYYQGNIRIYLKSSPDPLE